MSLVGTRPPTQEEVRLYEARHRMRLATKSTAEKSSGRLQAGCLSPE